MRALGTHVYFPNVPEICVEVLSPCNTEVETLSPDGNLRP